MRHWGSALSALAVSAVVLTPCFWLPLVSTGDLQSHLYNAWLARLIETGHAPGLWIEHRYTNVLLDHALEWLFAHWGPSVAERTVTACSVLTFFWGAFAYLSRSLGQRVDWLAPWLAILSYGYVFQLGLLNCYFSIGLVFWALAVLEPGISAKRVAALVPLLLVAFLAHPVPITWLVGVTAYRFIAERSARQVQAWLFAAGIAVLCLGRRYICAHFSCQWGLRQALLITGADQAVLYGWRYEVVALLFVALFGALLLTSKGRGQRLTSVRAQVYGLTAAAIAILPTTMRSNDQSAWAGLIAERLSLIAAVLLLALLGGRRGQRLQLMAGLAAALIFFAMLRVDLGKAAQIEARIEAMVAQYPARQRFITYLWDLEGDEAVDDQRTLRGRAAAFIKKHPPHGITLMHLLSRACVGRCFDYQNYEPSTGQFRIRARPDNLIVEDEISKVYGMEQGFYTMQLGDLERQIIYRCGAAPSALCVRALEPGQLTRIE